MDSAAVLNLVIGTAGHIDHGKSALVERLTGQHPDTLKEERERGLTINIGYATFTLSDGRKVGIIDVPGHERFIKNMVAGATGIRFVVFVVAADDSIMPQSREHLDILRILGVEGGVVALTKVDLVDAEMVEIACEEIADFVRGTFLEGAPVFPVSSLDGRGVKELRTWLDEALLGLHVVHPDLPFRVPIQRTFSATGYGTVVTGVPVSGRVRVGDTVEVLPRGIRSRVRGLEAYGERIEEAGAGHRTALNLSDADYREVGRGDVVAAPGLYRASRIVEARLRYLEGNPRALKHLAPIRFLTGTAEVVGRVAILSHRTLEPGQTGLVQLTLQEPVALAEGDRYILRSISPMTTVGGGRILGTSRSRLRRLRPWTLEHLRRKEAAVGRDPGAFLAEAVYGYGRRGAPVGELVRDCHRPAAEVERMAADLARRGVLLPLQGGRTVLHRELLERMATEIVEALEGLYAADPLSLFVPVRDVARRLRVEPALLEGILDPLEERKSIVRGPQRRVGLPDHVPGLTARQGKIREGIREAFREGFLAPPARGDLPERVGAGRDESGRLLDLLTDQGEILRLKGDVLLHREAVAEATRRVQEALSERGRMTASEIREMLGTNRKVLIPLLEHLDQIGFTVRDGDYRMLPEGHDAGNDA